MEFLSKLAEIPIGSYAAWGSIIFIAITGVVQISPIKIDPWSHIAGMIGRAINREVIAKVDKLEQDIADIRKSDEERDAQREESDAKEARRRILRFGDEVRHEQNHSKEHYDQIMQDITDYESYCDEHPDFKNKMTTSTTKIIVSDYESRLENNNFL